MEFHSTIVIGSGFGGSFAARALADGGERVLVLERGRYWNPGEFPRRPDELFANVWDPARGRYGLFDIRRFKGLHAVTAAGVGGGSLIYANVQLRKPSGWFTTAIDGQRSIDWPVSREELDRHYEDVAKLLDAGPFEAPVSVVPRAAAFEWAARRKGYSVFKPNLAVRFEPPEGDPDRPGRQSCTMCGECIIGCNVGAKNTLDLTVLRHDLIDVRPHALVRSIARRGPYFVVRYIDVEHVNGAAIAERREAVRELSCLVLVVAAGALGSTELLLRARAALPGLSAALGSRYSPNGDLLTFGSRIGHAPEAARFADQAADMGTGPTITRCVEVDGPGPDGQRFFLQDAALPSQLAWALLGLPTGGVIWRVLKSIGRRILELLGRDPRTRVGSDLARTLPKSPVSATIGVLGMGLDTADGRITMEQDQLQLDWTTRRSRRLLRRIEGASDEIIRALGGRTWPTTLTSLNRVVTVHSVGGVPMGTSAADGVVDGHGEVFDTPGLFVTDGSVMPGAVGANPSMTIAAFAMRAAERIQVRLRDRRIAEWFS